MSSSASHTRKRTALALAAGAAAMSILAPFAEPSRGADVSAPVIMQWFESSWQTMQKRTGDLFQAGYGAVWTPPPGRALYDDQGGGIGYNLYDRFDMGKANDGTLYGTENGYRSFIKSVHKTTGDVYIDYVHHHVGAWDVPAYNGWGGFTPDANAKIQDRSDYPGFELSDPYVGANSFNPNYRNLLGQRDSYPDAPPVNDGNTPQYQYQYRLAHLITLDLTSDRSFVRNPVPGNANDIRQAANGWAIGTSTRLANGKAGASTIVRQANTPDANNARFYPDLSLPGITITDPATGGGTYTIHPYNTANPLAGDATSETNVGYMMRYAQWLVNDIGVDGLRIDAARHVPYGQGSDPYNPNNINVPALIDRAVYKQGSRTNLDGTKRDVFSFQEVFSGDKNLLQQFTRKDINPATPSVVGGNRDVLDFPMWFAMRGNFTTNGTHNNWYNVRNASQDINDDGLANNGSQSIGFVINHDDGKGNANDQANDYIALDNVAHAWILMRPGNAYVYYNAHEFDRTGNNTFFLKDGRGDALGGQYGNIITNLVDIRNSYGRGDFKERFIDPGGNSAIYVFERENSALVGLNIGYNPGVATRTVDTAFAPGTHLEEQTGNWQDASGQVSRTVVVGADKKTTINIPWNNAGNLNKGYVIYGLPRPRGAMALSNVSQTLAPETQNASNNGSARISAIEVVTANSFNITLNTNAVTLSDGFRDHSADGDFAVVRMDEGLDLNGNGTVDFRTTGATNYGFENFGTTNNPGYFQASGNGSYVQAVDTTQLSEGYHYITTRAFRQRGDGGPEIFTDFKKVLYVDRLKPVSAMDSAVVLGGNDRDVRTKSVDQTADKVWTYINLPANMTNAQIIALTTGGASQIDVDLFSKTFTNVVNGNNAITVVTKEITGNTNVQRFGGQNLLTTNGAGLGDLNQNNTFEVGDITGTSYGMEAIVYPNGGGTTNFAFNAAADVNADGLIDSRDLYAVEVQYTNVGASQAVKTAARQAVLRRGDMDLNNVANTLDIDFLFAHRGQTDWRYDLDVDGWPTANGADNADVAVLVTTIFKTRFGDSDLNGKIDGADYAHIDTTFNTEHTAGNIGGWFNGDFNGDNKVDGADYAIIDANFNQQHGTVAGALAFIEGGGTGAEDPNSPGMRMVALHLGEFGSSYAQAFAEAVPEPGSAALVVIGAFAITQRRRKQIAQ